MGQLKLRWPLVLASLGATLLILFGGNFVLQHQTVDEPLAQRFAAVEAVESFEVQGGRDERTLLVRMGPVADLRHAYTEIQTEATHVLGKDNYTLRVVDTRTADLEEAYYRVHLHVQEGLATGQFSRMAEQMAAELGNLPVDQHRVSVDGKNLYVQLHSGDHYLYEIIPRGTPGRTAQEGG